MLESVHGTVTTGDGVYCQMDQHPDRAAPRIGGRQAGLGAALVRGANKPGARDPGAAALAHRLGADVSQAVLHGAGVPHPRGAVVSGCPSGGPAAPL